MVTWRRHPATAVAAGGLVGSAQALLLVGLARAARHLSTGADRGFGDWNIRAQGAWLLALVVLSLVLVAAALSVLRIGYAVPVAVAVLVAELVVADAVDSVLTFHRDWWVLLPVAVLAALFIAVQQVDQQCRQRGWLRSTGRKDDPPGRA